MNAIQRAVAWTTSDEHWFLEGLGTHSRAGQAMGRDELIKRYRLACTRRDRWGHVNSVEIRHRVALSPEKKVPA